MAPSKEWTFVRSWLRRVYNKRVHEYFKDLAQDEDPDITTGRSASKAACLIGANDSQNIALIKMNNFNFLVQTRDVVPMYAIPCSDYHDTVEFKPQVTLVFFERELDAVNNDRDPLSGEISFRVMNETGESLSQTEVDRLAREIKNSFGLPTPYRYKKGPIKMSYIDQSMGYRFILFLDDRNDAKEIITKVMALRGNTPNWKKLKHSNYEEEPDATPERLRILGKTYKKPTRGKRTYVYFRRAELKIWGLPEDIMLVNSASYLRGPAIEII